MRRISVVAVACQGWAILRVAPAQAHAAYKTSDPADESRVSAAPASVWAEYTEPPGPGSTMSITDPCGRRVDDGDVSHDGYRMSVGMSSDRAGTFTVSWYAVSTLDGHPSRGSFTFTATTGSPCPGSEKEGGSEPEEEKETSVERGSNGDGGQTVTSQPGDGSAAGAAVSGSPEGKAKHRRDGHHDEKSSTKRKDRSGHGARPGKTRVLGDRVERPKDLTNTLLVTFGLSALIGIVGGRVYAGWTESR
jgi:methionine-rich copper-binding protein CopC